MRLDRVRTEQEGHAQPQRSTSSAGRGSKNAFVTFARPRMAPKRRTRGCGRRRVRRATGVDPRAMMTSSPPSARSISRDNCVFAA